MGWEGWNEDFMSDTLRESPPGGILAGATQKVGVDYSNELSWP